MNDRELHIVKYILNKIENAIFQKKQISDEIKELESVYIGKDKDIEFYKKSNYLEGIQNQLSKDINTYEIDIKNILEVGDY